MTTTQHQREKTIIEQPLHCPGQHLLRLFQGAMVAHYIPCIIKHHLFIKGHGQISQLCTNGTRSISSTGSSQVALYALIAAKAQKAKIQPLIIYYRPLLIHPELLHHLM